MGAGEAGREGPPLTHEHRVASVAGEHLDAGLGAPDELAPEDVAELAAGHHQHRHDERVHGDHRLDRADRRVEIGDQTIDRKIAGEHAARG